MYVQYRLSEQVAELRREEHRLMEVISQLQCQQSSLQEGGRSGGSSSSEAAAFKQREKELMEVS